jgi:hypothetical protein
VLELFAVTENTGEEIMDEIRLGAYLFGVVVGWLTYYILAHGGERNIKDIAVVIGSIGGAAVLALFPAQTVLFGAYGIGLAIGFFLYWAILVCSLFFAYERTEAWRVIAGWARTGTLMTGTAAGDHVGPVARPQRGDLHGNT